MVAVNAVDEAMIVCPGQGVSCPRADGVVVIELGEVGSASRGKVHVLCIAVQDRCQLLAGDVRVRTEGLGIIALDDAVLGRPRNRGVVIRVGRNVRKLVVSGRSGFAGQSPQDGDDLAARSVLVCAEARHGNAVHKAVDVGVQNVVIVPVAVRHIVERQISPTIVILVNEADIERRVL